MTYTFETKDYGRVEISTQTWQAYFFQRDEIYEIDAHTGQFQDFNGTRFEFHAPIQGMKESNAILEVWRLQTIGHDSRTGS